MLLSAIYSWRYVSCSLILPRIEQLDRIDIYDLNGNLVGSQGFSGGQSVTIWNEYGVQSTTQIEMNELRNIKRC